MNSPLIIGFLEGPELIIVAAVILLLFGGAALPKFARSLGSAQKEFKKGLTDNDDEDEKAEGKSDKA